MKRHSLSNDVLFLANWTLLQATDSIGRKRPELATTMERVVRGDERRVSAAVLKLFEPGGPLRHGTTNDTRAVLNAAQVLGDDVTAAYQLTNLVGFALDQLDELTRRPHPELPWAETLTNSAWEPRITRARYAASAGDTGALIRELSPFEEDPAEVDRDFGRLIRAMREILEGKIAVGRGLSPGSKPAAMGPLSATRGRTSRADLVMAVLAAKSLKLSKDDRSKPRTTTRAQRLVLVEGLLRDPRWDDIDHTTGSVGVVAGILGGTPSPPIDLSAFDLGKNARIQRIER